jgi:hypothetical protein
MGRRQQRQGVGERLVVSSEDGEMAAIQHVAKMSDAQLTGEKFLPKAECFTAEQPPASWRRNEGAVSLPAMYS